MPMPRLLRMRNSVKHAPTSMPPTAMGRTMKLHTATDSPAQNPVSGMVVPAGANCATSVGPPRNRISGTSRPQAMTPPAKFSEASRGPMM